MFTQSLINVLYQIAKESGVNGYFDVDPNTLEVNNGYAGIRVFFSDSDSEEHNKARIELALLGYYNLQ